MMEKCFDAGTIQAFLDGELAPQLQEKVARHVSGCDTCASSLAEAEEETAFAFSALEQEFSTLVPTKRLWMKINDSIEQKQSKSIWQTAFANFKLLFASPSIAAFASLLIVAGIFSVVWSSRNTSETESYIAKRIENPKQKSDTVKPTMQSSSNEKADGNSTFSQTKNISTAKESGSYRIVKAGFENSSNTNERKPARTIRQTAIYPATPNQPVTAQYLPGEESYIKTIAALEKTVDNHKDEVLKPSARFSFERDLAVANDAIDKMKSEVKNNPKNEAAKQVLLSSYQNKIDLLNTVAQKNDLMASLR
ncbi:MAG: zf-HC2 domain-containing protein [Acidobacteriota bacterium]|nr:zf-HC2 domain-containing protein [Acidobacteriota bacterium]